MKFYKSDGSYVEKPEDTAFGWTIEETIDNEILSGYRQNGEKSKNKIYPDEIKVQEAESAVDFQLNPETSPSKLENIDSKIPSKTQVANLINPCCVESKMLLSVVHFAKYKNLKREINNLGDLTESSKLKFLINNDDVEGDIRHAINNYHKNQDDNVLSLMMEIILADTKSELDDIADCPQKNGVKINQDLVDGYPSLGSKHDLENRSELLDSIGFGDIIDRSLERMCEETVDIHMKISDLKKSFQDDELRVDNLIERAQNLEKNLRETKFLDDLVHLLNGDLHKVQLKKSPFRIFLDPSDQEEANLIV